MDRPFELRVKHVVYFASFHIGTIIALAFWVGAAYNRLGSVEQRAMDNTASIRIIQDSGTPAQRVQFEAIKDQLRQAIERLDRIERQTK